MARSAIAVTSASKNSSAAMTLTTRAGGITGAAGLYIPNTASPDDSCVLQVTETCGDTGSIWVKAGSGVANAGQGDLEVVVAGSATIIVGPLERTRFGFGDTGTIDIDSGITGIFTVIDVRN